MMVPTKLPRNMFLLGKVSISEGEIVVTIAVMIVVISVMISIMTTECVSFATPGVAPREEREDIDHDGTTTTLKGQTSVQT